MKEIDAKDLVDKNFMFLTMLGYASAIIFDLKSTLNTYTELTSYQAAAIDWYHQAIENVVYKNIPAPRMP